MQECQWLSLYNNRHHYWSTTREQIAVLGDLTTESLDELTSLDLGILDDQLLICLSDSLQYLLVDIHHLIRMDESTRIDENMTRDRTSSSIFL